MGRAHLDSDGNRLQPCGHPYPDRKLAAYGGVTHCSLPIAHAELYPQRYRDRDAVSDDREFNAHGEREPDGNAHGDPKCDADAEPDAVA